MAKSARHTRLSIMEFHRMLPDVGPSGGDELPRGPSGDPGRADGTHKWISKWDGLPVVVSELPSADVPASALVVDTLDAFKEALDLVLDEYLNGFDPSEAARCILELRVRARPTTRHAAGSSKARARLPTSSPRQRRPHAIGRPVSFLARFPAPLPWCLRRGCGTFVFSHVFRGFLAARVSPA
eukprot:scaffold11117_cov79-Isochrysis_galbana.AAC.1